MASKGKARESNEWKDTRRKTREEAVRVQRPSDLAEYSRLMKQSKCMISGISQAKLSSGAGLRYSLLPHPSARSSLTHPSAAGHCAGTMTLTLLSYHVINNIQIITQILFMDVIV